jgi:hypothetical protein
VICWNDFILDDVLGPVLNFDKDETSYASCRMVRNGRPSTSDDQAGRKPCREFIGTEVVNQIQETSREKQPARMVGHSELDSNRHEDMEVDRTDRAPNMRLRGEV